MFPSTQKQASLRIQWTDSFLFRSLTSQKTRLRHLPCKVQNVSFLNTISGFETVTQLNGIIFLQS